MRLRREGARVTKTRNVLDLPPISADEEERVLAALMASSEAYEEMDDSPELVEAFFALGREAAAGGGGQSATRELEGCPVKSQRS